MTSKLIIFLNWPSGQLSNHELAVVYVFLFWGGLPDPMIVGHQYRQIFAPRNSKLETLKPQRIRRAERESRGIRIPWPSPDLVLCLEK